MTTSVIIRTFVLVAGIMTITATTLAAQDDPAVSELLENFFRSNENASESDAQLFLEQLEQWRAHPLELNTATREDLQALRLLNDLQVEQFLTYRSALGNLLNIYELQAIPGWDLADIRRILPFVEVSNGGLDRRATPLRSGLLKGQNEILVRTALPHPLPYTNGAEGGPYGGAIRYRHTFDGRLRYGFTAENDPGEAFFQKSNPAGFDFYSAHLFIQQKKERGIHTFALGDYTARLGQGMLLQTGFSPGKSAESVQLMRNARRLGAYSAFGEAYFLRGVGVGIALSRQWELLAFTSFRRRDANITAPRDSVNFNPEEQVFSSLQTSGLHRTASEIADERAIAEWLAGASLTWKKAFGQISLNSLWLRYDRAFSPSPAPYRIYAFQGRQLFGFSLDHQLRWRNFLFFGENAQSENGAAALLNGVLIGADRKVTIGVVHRHFDPAYQAVYAAPFAEVSNASNERGLYTGVEIRPSKPWKINAYADVWRHPWLRFGVGAPSYGQEFLMRVLWQPQRHFQTYVIWQAETKQRNAVAPEAGLANHRRNRFRFHAGYKMSPAIELRSRVEWLIYQQGDLPGAKGLLMYQEAVVKPRNFPVSGTVRYALFDTEDYNSRVYAFENDLFSAVSIPGFAGRGNRYYVNLTWRITQKWRFEARYQTTWLQRAVTSGSVVGRESLVRVQVRGQW